MTRVLTFLFFSFFSAISFAQLGWYNQDSGTNNELFGVSFVDENNGWAGGGYGTMLHTTNGGEDWIQQSIPNNAYLSTFFADSQNGWAGGYSGYLIHTTNGGQSWVSQNTQASDHIYSIYFINADTGWAAGGKIASFPSNFPESLIIGTTDGGNTWVVQYYQQYSPILHNIFFVDNSDGYAIGGAYLFHTTNGGAVWTQETVIAGNLFSGIFFSDIDTGWITGQMSLSDHSGEIYKTTDGGNSWNGTTLGLDENLTDIYFPDEVHGWAVGGSDIDSSGVIYYTSDGGGNWTLQNTPVFHSFFKLDFVNNTGWAVGHLGEIARSDNIVPVELTLFTAQLNNNNVNLNWQTATETNNSGFEIWRSECKEPEVRNSEPGSGSGSLKGAEHQHKKIIILLLTEI